MTKGKKDKRGKLFKRLFLMYYLIVKIIFSFIMKTSCKFKNIKLAKNVSFYGKIYLYRAPYSSITIGKKCTFRSKEHSNLIGINRKCSISTLSSNATIEIGNNCGFSGTVVGSFKSIKVGNNVRCGANTLITDSDWHSDDPRTGPPQEIVINDNVWLGVNAVVLKGVTIGKNSIIGANSVVVKDIPENVIAAGNPCRVIKSL